MTSTRVLSRGRIVFRGRVFAHTSLIPREGQLVSVIRDQSIGEADCIVHDPATREFVCNAHNARRWATLLRGIDTAVCRGRK